MCLIPLLHRCCPITKRSNHHSQVPQSQSNHRGLGHGSHHSSRGCCVGWRDSSSSGNSGYNTGHSDQGISGSGRSSGGYYGDESNDNSSSSDERSDGQQDSRSEERSRSKISEENPSSDGNGSSSSSNNNGPFGQSPAAAVKFQSSRSPRAPPAAASQAETEE